MPIGAAAFAHVPGATVESVDAAGAFDRVSMGCEDGCPDLRLALQSLFPYACPAGSNGVAGAAAATGRPKKRPVGSDHDPWLLTEMF